MATTRYQYPYGAAAEENFGGGPQYNPDWTQSDPYEQFKQNRQWAADRGNRLDQGLANDQVYRRGLEQGYRGTADQMYGSLSDNPGYTPGEQNNIVRDQQYQQGMTSPGDLSKMGPTDAEYSGMSGQPNDYYNWFDPESMYQNDASSAAQQRHAVDMSETGIQGAVGDQQQAYGQALDNPELGPNQKYGDSMDAVLNSTHDRLGQNQDTTADSLNTAANNPNLGITGEYARQAGMTDAEVQQTAEAGARDVGLRYQAQMGDVARRAAESGNASPLAIAAAQARLGQQSATESADARTNADLAARAAQRQAATGVEQTRLGAQQYQTGAQMQAGTTLGQMGQQGAEYQGSLAQQNVQQQENTRQQANQYLTGQRMNAAGAVAGNRMQGAEFVGGLRAGTEQGIGGQGANTQRFVQQQGGQIASNVENANANRQSQLYNIRRGNQQYANDTSYGQNFQTQGALSQGYGNTANARRQDLGEARGYYSGQGNQQAQYGQQNSQMRLQNYGTQGQLQNQATQGYGQYDLGRRGNSFGTAFKQNLGSSLGKLAGGAPGYGYGGGG